LTDSLFFDTDCISAFLWVKNESLLPQLYPGRIVIPGPVYEELSNPKIVHLKVRIDALVSVGQAEIVEIIVGTKEYNMFYKLAVEPDQGQKLIGRGEASSIALAKENDGIVASNNLRDISIYIEEFQLKHITTGEILINAYNKELITEVDGNTIWASMLAKRRKLGAASFSDFLKSK
jgi:predicted nucleic acid-binding protein